MALSVLAKVGFAQETTWGTAVAANNLMPVDGDPKFTEQIAQILDEARRGIASKDFGAYQGVGYSEVEFGGPAYPEEIGYFLKAILGGASVSGAGPYTHTFVLASTVSSFTIEDGDPVQARKYAGCQVESLALKFSSAEGLLTYTVKLKGKRGATVTFASISDATTAPWKGWQCATTIGGGAFTKVISAEIMMSRPQEPVNTANSTQDCLRIDPGPLEVTLNYTIDKTADTDFTKYTGKTQEAQVITFTNGTKVLAITATNVDYGDGPAERDLGGANVKLSWKCRALYNSTDAGPIKIVLTNAKSAYTS